MGLVARALRRLPTIRPTREQTLLTTERIAAVGQLLSSVEYLMEPRSELPGRANEWATLQATRFTFRSGVARRIVGAVADRRVVTGLHVLRVGAALLLLAPTGRRTRFAAGSTLAVTSALLYPHESYGSDGSDQATFVAQSAAALARAVPDRPALVDAALWYVAAQGTLSYAVSGWAKLLGPQWRNGEALPGVLRTYTYGDRQAYRLVRRYPRTARVLGAAVLALECFFPLAYLGRGRAAPLFVGSAAAFHVVNARLMGLHRFVPAFLALHPSVLYTAGPRRAVTASGPERRDDLFPVVLAAGGVAVVAGAYRAHRRRRALVTAGRPGEQRLTTGTGNELTFRRSGRTAPGVPLVVVEGGLAATIEQNVWLERGLGERFAVLSYQRAGYGSSRYRWPGEYHLDVALRDLTDLVADQAGDRPVVVLGHSLGGYLAWLAVPRLTDRLGDRVRGVALLDATHPDELLQSAAQYSGALFHDRHFDEVAVSLRLGLGVLTERPEFVDDLPADVRDLVHAQYADPGMWAAARREWRAVRTFFGHPDARLRPVDVPAVVLTAERTATLDPVQVRLHDEMAQAAAWSHRHVVADTSHESVVVTAEGAARVVDLVAAFVDAAVAARPGRVTPDGAPGAGREPTDSGPRLSAAPRPPIRTA
ncbi:alpha/beta fold hydrolase [Micromonospora fluostatini]|uniref:alpha/beta fold hydrolase n=1 Tax=Micromonospora sp. JCM 30529 TaxID=3421643 RepID=UPI003D186AE4